MIKETKTPQSTYCSPKISPNLLPHRRFLRQQRWSPRLMPQCARGPVRVHTVSPSLVCQQARGRYHGGRRPSSDDSLHSPTVIPPSALDNPSIMKRYHRREICSHTSPRRSPTMVTLHDTRFVECRWWNDGWTVKTVVT